MLNVIYCLCQFAYHGSGDARQSLQGQYSALTAFGAILSTGPNNCIQSTGGAGRADTGGLYRIFDGLSIHSYDGSHCSTATCVVSRTIFAIKALEYELVDVDKVDIQLINQAIFQSIAVSDELQPALTDRAIQNHKTIVV